jgi:hypothetical protein
LVRGRAIASSEIFLGCVAKQMQGTISLDEDVHAPFRIETNPGPYDPCTGDPFFDDSVPAQWPDVIAVTRSTLGLRISCDPNLHGTEFANSNVTTNPGQYEQLKLIEPRIAISMENNDLNLVAGAIWHEGMHQHGYVHGTAGTAEGCKLFNRHFPDDDENWMKRHTIPYIVQNCMTYLGDISDSCPSEITCGRGWVALRTGLSPSSKCGCVRDPAFQAF